MAEFEIDVAVPAPVMNSFSYLARDWIEAGSRVLVPFGGRKLVGVVMDARVADETKGSRRARDFELKEVIEIIDKKPVYSQQLRELALWVSRYYQSPLGEVLRTMLPAQSVTTKYGSYEKTPQLDHVDSLDKDLRILAQCFAKKAQLREQTLKKKLAVLLNNSSKESIQKILNQAVKKGFLRKTQASVVKARRSFIFEDLTDARSDRRKSQTIKVTQKLRLTQAQAQVFEQICQKGLQAQEPLKPFLLEGITGSGKTEIYLQVIEQLLREQEEAQCLLMVPEIALTPQMMNVFHSRFPGIVAVVHSAMADSERWEELERIRSQQARILIGPRSAVFAPFAQLRLIIVDEEHDPSYKQTTGVCYHGRDVAVVRAQLEHAVLVLGSATPSLESYYNAQIGKYHHCVLKERISQSGLAKVHLVKVKPAFLTGQELTIAQLQQSKNKLKVHKSVLIAPEVIEALRETVISGEQAIVLANRRGYAYYLYGAKSGTAVSCQNCSISLTLHEHQHLLRCHYCDYEVPTLEYLRAHQDDRYFAVGFGSEKVELILQEALGDEARIARVDSDMIHQKGGLYDTLKAFREGHLNILVGTQILAKGHDFPNVSLVVLLEVDQLLDLPDFRAGERAFQLMVQASGRAGRSKIAGRVFVQTSRPDHPIVRFGLEQNFLAFAQRELPFRKAHGYPPFTRVLSLEMSSLQWAKLDEFCDRVEAWFLGMLQRKPDWARQVKILGPAIPAIAVLRRRHRRTLLMISQNPAILFQLAKEFRRAFHKLPSSIRVKIDVDPQSFL